MNWYVFMEVTIFNFAFILLLLIFCCAVAEVWQLNNRLNISVQQIKTLVGCNKLCHWLLCELAVLYYPLGFTSFSEYIRVVWAASVV
jgi:hypothetical protein